MARPGRDAEELRERGQADPAPASLEQPPRERRRAQRRLGEAPPVSQEELPLEEPLVEAGVVRDEEIVAREGEKAPKDSRDGGGAAQLLIAQARQPGDRLRQRDSGIHE